MANDFEEGATKQAPLSPVSATVRAAPALGERVGKYVIERTIGQGGMGIVVAARHETLDEMVAIKLLHPKAAKDALQVERFVREARATVRIKSEHVVRVLDAGAEESTGAPFIVMELLEGRDLGHVLSASGPLPTSMAVDYMIQICEGVGAAHALGVVHRDLKPSNFFLTRRPDGSALVKVLDFGISKAAQADGTPDPRLTETQAVFGSPTYMSPEQIRSSKNVDARSDVWSLGVALFELLTGKLPFMADNVAGLLASVVADPPFPITAFVPDAPRELEAIVLACLEKNAARRVGSAAELAMRLAPFASPDGALLATRIERGARNAAGGASVPAPPLSVPPPSSLPAPPLSHRTAVMSSALPNAPPSYPSAPAPAVAYGSTGTDLSSTGQAEFRASVRRGSGRTIAMAVGALALAGVVGGVILATRSAPHAREAASPSESAPVAGPVVAPPPSAVAMPSASAAPVVDAPVVASAPAPLTTGVRRVKPAPAGQGRPGLQAAPVASAPASAAPPKPPSPNLDSRF